MEKEFETIRKTRNFLRGLIDNLTTQQLNKIPEGFNNNIVWNFVHIVAAQEGVCYRRGGLPLNISDALFEKYKPGSKPAGFVNEDELNEAKSLMNTTVDKLEEDYKAGRFSSYSSWVSRYGVEIKSIEDAVSFISFHDGLHIGYIMALRHCV